MSWYLFLKLFLLIGSLSFINCIFLLAVIRNSINYYVVAKDVSYVSQILGGIDLGEKGRTQED